MTNNIGQDSPQMNARSSKKVLRYLQTLMGNWGKEITSIMVALAGSFLIGGVLILFSGGNPFQAYLAILKSAFGDSYAIASTISRGLPIIGAGIAAGWAFNAGLLNMGGEGQLLLGGLATFLVSEYVPLPPYLVLPMAILAAMVVGGLWALFSGWLDTKFEVPILVSSLLMNFLAIGFVSYTINFKILEVGGSRSQSPLIAETLRLKRLISGTSLSSGLYLIIGLVILTIFILRQTAHGYELRIFGANREFAISGGVDPVRMTLVTMFSSGLMAGMVGSILVLGVHYRLIDGALTIPGYAWTGMMAAILANNNPIGIVVGGLFFSAVQTGAAGMERALSIPFEISFVVQAIIIILVASRGAFRREKREDLA